MFKSDVISYETEVIVHLRSASDRNEKLWSVKLIKSLHRTECVFPASI